jgi:hypothetical protein
VPCTDAVCADAHGGTTTSRPTRNRLARFERNVMAAPFGRTSTARVNGTQRRAYFVTDIAASLAFDSDTTLCSTPLCSIVEIRAFCT